MQRIPDPRCANLNDGKEMKRSFNDSAVQYHEYRYGVGRRRVFVPYIAQSGVPTMAAARGAPNMDSVTPRHGLAAEEAKSGVSCADAENGSIEVVRNVACALAADVVRRTLGRRSVGPGA